VIVILGGGPAGRAALAVLPGACLISRPAMAWHAEPGRLWIEEAGVVRAEPWTTLLVCANEPLLLAALGCAFAGLVPVTGEAGHTTVAGVFAAGRIRGASAPGQAADQGRRAAAAIGIAPITTDPVPGNGDRLDPVAIAGLLEQPPGPERNRAVLEQYALLGPIVPARPVGLAALAALPAGRPLPRPVQQDQGSL